jgi:hypothetical protein
MNIAYKLPTQQELVKYIKAQNKKLSTAQLNNIVTMANRDIRKSLLMSNFPNSTSDRDYLQGCVFEITKLFMSQMTSLSEKINLYDKEDMIPLMVHENYIKTIVKYSDPIETLENMSRSADGLSDYDLVPHSCFGVIAATSNSHAKSTVTFPTTYFKYLAAHTKRKQIHMRYNEMFNTKSFNMDYLSYMAILIYHKPSFKHLVEFCKYHDLCVDDLKDNFTQILFIESLYSSYDYTMFDKKTKLQLTKHFTKYY